MRKTTKNVQAEQQKIGYFIKTLRNKRGMTQKEFADLLKTSQSAVARMEAGGQNFTTGELVKISAVLNKRIISLENSSDFKIVGGKKLSGTITTNTSKNGALHLMFAALANKGTTTLKNVPRIEEVFRVCEIFESIGIRVKWISEHDLAIRPPTTYKLSRIDKAASKKVRSVLMILGALIHETRSFTLPHSGGCKMGERTIAAHKYALEAFGVSVVSKEDEYKVSHTGLSAREVVMYETSDTATTNTLIAAARLPGTTVIRFASSNYMVQDVCFFLQKLGVRVEGVGTATLTVVGREDIRQDVSVFVGEDPIESMMFLTAAIVTKSKLIVKRCPIDFLLLELRKLKHMGLRYKMSKPYLSENGGMRLADITVFPSTLTALTDKIHALPYPGINADNLPFFVPIATQAEGQTLIHDWMWENRAIYFTELNRLGANITLADPHRVFIQGKTNLYGAQVVCPPALRPSTIVLLAMLAAKGTSVLRNVYSIKRGYEEVAERLNGVGAEIEVVSSM